MIIDPQDRWFTLLLIYAVAAVSAVFYRHKKDEYRLEKSEPIPSDKIFEAFYRWIQITSLLIATAPVIGATDFILPFHNRKDLLYFGDALCLLALTIFVHAKSTLSSQYSPCFDSYLPNKIIEKGIYEYIRHPIYTSNLILLTGVSLATGSLIMVGNTLFLLFFYYRAALREEIALCSKFSEYRNYMQKTGMFFFNFARFIRIKRVHF